MISGLLIAGLGNPGAHYTDTRHNLGAAWVTRLCNKHNVSLQLNTKLSASIARIEFNTKNIICMIPNDYMNHSGFAIKKTVAYYKLEINNILIVHDELDLLPGDIRLKLDGGHGGHNGLRHIIEQLQTNNFKRLRIGIGHPKIREQVSDYVLRSADKVEQSLIDLAIEHSLQIIPDLTVLNWPQIMQFLHQPKPKISGEV